MTQHDGCQIVSWSERPKASGRMPSPERRPPHSPVVLPMSDLFHDRMVTAFPTATATSSCSSATNSSCQSYLDYLSQFGDAFTVRCPRSFSGRTTVSQELNCSSTYICYRCVAVYQSSSALSTGEKCRFAPLINPEGENHRPRSTEPWSSTLNLCCDRPGVCRKAEDRHGAATLRLGLMSKCSP